MALPAACTLETNSRVWRCQNRANGVASRSSRQLQLAAPVSLDFSKGLSCRPTAKSILPSYLEIWQCQIFTASSLVCPKTLELMVSSRRSRLLHKQVAKTAARHVPYWGHFPDLGKSLIGRCYGRDFMSKPMMLDVTHPKVRLVFIRHIALRFGGAPTQRQMRVMLPRHAGVGVVELSIRSSSSR